MHGIQAAIGNDIRFSANGEFFVTQIHLISS